MSSIKSFWKNFTVLKIKLNFDVLRKLIIFLFYYSLGSIDKISVKKYSKNFFEIFRFSWISLRMTFEFDALSVNILSLTLLKYSLNKICFHSKFFIHLTLYIYSSCLIQHQRFTRMRRKIQETLFKHPLCQNPFQLCILRTTYLFSSFFFK